MSCIREHSPQNQRVTRQVLVDMSLRTRHWLRLVTQRSTKAILRSVAPWVLLQPVFDTNLRNLWMQPRMQGHSGSDQDKLESKHFLNLFGDSLNIRHCQTVLTGRPPCCIEWLVCGGYYASYTGTLHEGQTLCGHAVTDLHHQRLLVYGIRI